MADTLKFRYMIAFASLPALLVSHAVHAADSVYLGDCTRAQTIKNQSTIDTLILEKRYEGVQSAYTGGTPKTECKAVELSLYTLTRRSVSTQELVFDITRNDIRHGTVPNCMSPTLVAGTVVGTARFTTTLDKVGELCEVNIWSAWTQTDPNDPKWSGNFSARVVTSGPGNFVVRQPRSGPGKYRTPLAFAGVQ